MLKITLARHAETVWNEQLRYIGRTDLSLSPLGRANAGLLAAYLKDTKVDAIYASDMHRAAQTAGETARTHNLAVQHEPLLNEIDFGAWEGLTHEEIILAYPGTVEEWAADPFNIPIPAGEPWPVFAARVWRGWKKIVAAALAARPKTDSHILIVTHAGCIKTILGRIMDLDSEMWWRLHQDKGALNHLAIDNGIARVLFINDTGYRQGAVGADEAQPYTIERCGREDVLKIHFVIRKAAAGYAAIMGPGFDAETYMSPAQLGAEMDRMTFYAAVNGGFVVGVMGFEPVDNLALIRHAYVLPACQRLGLGGRLLRHIEAEAAKDGRRRLLVGTYTDNAAAIGFYEKNGFSIAGDPQALLTEYWDIPQRQACGSLVLEKALPAKKSFAGSGQASNQSPA